MEDPVRVLVERLDVARARVGEAPHRHAAQPVGAFGVLVLPGDVVARAGRQHVDLVPLGQPLGDQPAVVLGAAEDLGAVALNDEGDSHVMVLATHGDPTPAASVVLDVRSVSRLKSCEPAPLAGDDAAARNGSS